ncbi:MAG: lysophospholipid acyltransferase family protein [Candidatus Aminicenantes bacterium]|jgi:1-acyl-sn-glycerol-3-phosphate acyltransferase
MKPLMWKLINMGQVTFFFFWSFLWQTIAICLRFLTWSQAPSLWLARTVWAPPLLFITGSRVKVEGRDKIDFSEPHIFIFNHQSTLDIAVAFRTIPVGIRFIAKKELKSVPFLGWYMRAMGMIFVDRKRSQKAFRSLEKASELIRKGADIVSFAEGTRSPNGKIQSLKKGTFVVALQTGVPVVPVAIEGTRHVMPKNTFKLRPHLIRVAFGQPLATKDLKYEDRADLIKDVREQLIALNLSIGGLGGE